MRIARRPHGRVLAGDPLDLGRAQAGRRGRAFRAPLGGTRAQLGLADGVPREVVAVLEAVAEDDVHHPERERRVGAGQQREVPVRLLGGPRAVRVDRDQPRAAPARLLDERPQVDVRADDVRAPGEDQPRVHERLGVEADRAADAGLVAGGARARADRAVEQARARARGRSAGPCCRTRAGPCCRRTSTGRIACAPCSRAAAPQPLRDQRQRLVPGDALEAALALRGRRAAAGAAAARGCTRGRGSGSPSRTGSPG